MLAISRQLELATRSLLPRPSPHRKYLLGGSGKYIKADLGFSSEIPGVNKAVANRGCAWPTQGGLQSIANVAPFHGQIPTMPARSSVMNAIPPRAFTAVSIKPDIVDMSTKSKTPSPQKLTVKVDAAGGKENVRVNVTPQSAC